MSEVAVIVVADSPGSLGKVQAASESHGLREVKALPHLGMLKGLIARERMDELKRLPNVRSVELEGEIQLPPPTSPVQ